jgi:uncharacterized protein YndB with AHSA1/START domain
VATHPADEPIHQAVTVPVPAQAAFAAFADLAGWWPPEYTWAADTLEAIGIEPREGGHCFERGPHGFTLHWGRVLAWEPPARLIFTWQIAPTGCPSRTRPRPARSRATSTPPATPPPGRARAPRLHPSRPSRRGVPPGHGLPQGWPLLLDRYAATLAL